MCSSNGALLCMRGHGHVNVGHFLLWGGVILLSFPESGQPLLKCSVTGTEHKLAINPYEFITLDARGRAGERWVTWLSAIP